MFGLNDNANGANTDANAANSDSNGGMPPLSTSVPGSGSNGDAAPSINTAPPAPVDNNPPVAPAPPPSAVPTAGISDVNSDQLSYIASIASDHPQTNIPAGVSPPSDLLYQPTSPAPSVPSSANGNDLMKIKQQALQSLEPLVDHLEQPTEEKFKTTMMLIQASDNSNLIPEAYATANKITDAKVRAQALLDVVNEINYFTQQHQ